jgi:tetratricopeptide (TPR) repeat protein
MAIDLVPLWDFGRPEISEQRMRSALVGATGDDALILQTQIARTFGLRKDFEGARRLLHQIEPEIAAAGAEARVRHQLELGRTYASATHAPEQQTAESRLRARQAFDAALQTARGAGLDGLAIDAIHMFAFIDTGAADQLEWARKAMEVVQASSQADARRWEASIRNNLGVALHQLGRHEQALAEFQAALAIRERQGQAEAIRVAHWMIAWTLRSLGRIDEALAIQLRLEQENDAAGAPDRYVFEELEALYRARGEGAQADRYAARRAGSN